MQQSSWGVDVAPLAGSSRFNMKSRFWCWALTPSRLWSFMLFMKHATSSFSFWKCKRAVERIFHERQLIKFFRSFRASGDLQAILDDDGSLTEQKTRNCIREVLKALDYLHRRNVAHLDIKPQNILLNSNNLEGKEDIQWASHSFDRERPLYNHFSFCFFFLRRTQVMWLWIFTGNRRHQKRLRNSRNARLCRSRNHSIRAFIFEDRHLVRRCS